eukprot:5706973-Pyramimonas_sp.AAC.1
MGQILSEDGFGVNLSKHEVSGGAFGAGPRALSRQIRQGKYRLVLRGPPLVLLRFPSRPCRQP